MLKGGEKDGAKVLLRLMEPDDVVSLAKTVTNNRTAIRSIDEAVNMIIEFSTNGIDLLKRRKIKRELLFQYLMKEHVIFEASFSKIQLATKVLEHWGTQNVDILDLMEVDDSISQNDAPTTGAMSLMSGSSNDSFLQHNSLSNQQPNLLQDLPQQTCPASVTVPSADSWISDFMNFEHSIQVTSEDQQMGQEFAKWFYCMLNACNPGGEPFHTTFGPEHFFPDCELKVALVNLNQLEAYHGIESVCEKFLQLTRTELLIFCANVDSNGIMSLATPHGMKIFLVCGTLHKGENIVGVFAQQFGLVRNPERQFNWNIKFTNLKLIAGAPHQQPTLKCPGTLI